MGKSGKGLNRRGDKNQSVRHLKLHLYLLD